MNSDHPHHHKHRTKVRKRNGASSGKLEKYITNYFFRILGILFFIAGAVYLVRLAKPGESLFSTITAFFSSGGGEETRADVIFPFAGWKVLIRLLPGFALLAVPFFLYHRNPAVARILALTGTLWIFFVHLKVLSYDFISTATCYPNLWVAMAVTLALCILPFCHATRLKNASLQVMTVILVYFSLLFLTNNYQWHYFTDFLFLLIFTGIVLLLSFKTGKLVPFYIQAFLSILFVAVFWIRRMVMRDSGDLVSTYIIISSLFYGTFFLSGLVINLSKRNITWELVAFILMLVNTLFYAGSVLWVLSKYGHPELQGLFILILVLFNSVLLYFSPKINPGLFRNPYLLLTLVLAALVCPLLAHQNYIILFSSVISVLLLLYSKYSRNRLSLSASVAFVAVMTATFIYKCTLFYLPGLFSGAIPFDVSLFYNGFQAGTFTLFALFFSYKLVKRLELSASKWFSRRMYRMVLKSLLIVFAYITGFWTWHFLFSLLLPIGEAILLSWFWFTCLFLILLLPLLDRQKSVLLMPVSGFTALTLLSYPIFVNYSLVAIRNIGLVNGGIFSSCFLSHWLLFPLLPLLTSILYFSLRKTWVKRRVRMKSLQAFITGLCLTLLIIEYDHFTIFFGFAGGGTVSEMAVHNNHLPWSILGIIFSVALISVALIRKQRFIRQLAVALLLASLVKILIYDFGFLGEAGRIILLFLLGAFLIVFSFFYQRFRKKGIGSRQ
ncbi:MAG: hypothetical protein NTW10_12000 [Bacteroidetes bacterium]|nr:hypothetical protein [Bacteroidota bacterium]